jgi:phosphate transport system substrate-binding protein
MKTKDFYTLLLGGTVLLLGSCATGPSAGTSGEATDGNHTIKIGGSSETYEVLELLADNYSATKAGVTVEFFPPSQTAGGIEGVKAGIFDIGGVSRAITAEESGDTLTYLPLAETPMVLVVHDSVTGVTNLSADQIKALYKGDITNWQALGGPDAAIVLLDLAEDENEKQVLREHYLGADLNITPDAVVIPEDDELIETVGSTEFSIAAVPLEDELEELPVSVLSIDGIAPSPENLQSNAYGMTLPMGIVMSGSPSPTTQAFVEFVTSAAGQQILTEADDTVAQSAN